MEIRIRHYLPLIALSLTLLVGCGSESEESTGGLSSGDAATPSVEVVQARLGSLPLKERLTGLVRAENQVAIYSEITAPVIRVMAQDGDYVEQGEALVYLRDTQFQDQLRQAEASLQINEAEAKRAAATLRELEARFNRVKQLVDKQLQSVQELETLQAQVDGASATYEQAQARIAQAQATVEEQREALRRTVVRAPISGYVGQRNVEIGMRVDGGTQLFMIGNFDVVRVEVSIPDQMISRIKTGQTALITLEGRTNQTLSAEVSRISPFLNEGSYSAGAQIDVPNGDMTLRPGMFVLVDVLYGESEQATLLPEATLYEDPKTGALGVYVAPSLSTETPLQEPDSYDQDNLPALTEPTPMSFLEVDVLARGSGIVGVTQIQAGDWVVSVGQNLLSGRNEDRVMARARPMTWERVGALQQLQDQDLLKQFMEKQQRLARESYQAQNTALDEPGNEPASTPAAASDATQAASDAPATTPATQTVAIQ